MVPFRIKHTIVCCFFLREPENIKTYLTENEILLDEKQKEKLILIVEKLEKNETYRIGRKFFNRFFTMPPCEENGVSISGLRYVHLPYGPVPENFNLLLGTMEADHIVRIEVFYDNGYERHQVIPEKDIPNGILSDKEQEVLKRINDKFACFGSGDISSYSHKEKGYEKTKKGEIISYAYAKDVELN